VRIDKEKSKRKRYRPRAASVTSSIMSRVRGQNNRAEVALRHALWWRGFRYQLYRRDLKGKPDIVFAAARVAIFVDGDFWHGRALIERGAEGLKFVVRGKQYSWWHQKLSKTVARDLQTSRKLRSEGWLVVRIWESELVRDLDGEADRIAAHILRRLPTANRQNRKSSTSREIQTVDA
jgi:DNA mismatch endonuclease, patch repair protein